MLLLLLLLLRQLPAAQSSALPHPIQTVPTAAAAWTLLGFQHEFNITLAPQSYFMVQ